MKEMTEAQDKKLGVLARRRARQLGVGVRDITGGSLVGAYYYEPLSLVEFCLHEAAHLITLGHNPSDFPKLRRALGSLTEQVSNRSSGLTKHVSDALEIDSAITTYFAGVRLSYWDDPEAIIRSCSNNMSKRESAMATVRGAFAAAGQEDMSSHYWRKSDMLAQWFEG